MKVKNLALLALAVVLMGSPSHATVTFTNTYPCWIAVFTLCKITVIDGQYMGMTTEDHYIYPGQQVTFYDEGGPYQSYWVQKNQHSVSWLPFCGYVVAINGLPPVVCVGETYTVTAVSNGQPLSQGVVWGGDASILSQSGNTAVVRFSSSGASKSLFAAAPGQTQPVALAQTAAVTVSYSPVLPPGMAAAGGIQFPPRGGPASVPYNAVAEVRATFSHDIGSTPLRFKIVNQSDQNGRAVFDGTSELSGTGGTLRVRGTSQTAAGTSSASYAGRLKISTSTKEGESTCSPSDGFSVCAHPTKLTWTYGGSIAGAPTSSGLRWGHYWLLTEIRSDSGQSNNLSAVSILEDVTFVNHDGAMQSAALSTVTKPWIAALPPPGQQYGDVISYVGPSASSANAFWAGHGSTGSETRSQIWRFACTRCGIPQTTSAPIVSESGVLHKRQIRLKQGSSTIHEWLAKKQPDSSAGATAAAVANPDPHAVSIQ